MSKRILTLIVFLVANLFFINGAKAKSIPPPITIDVHDTVVIDLANAKIINGLFEVPVTFISDDVINGLDFRFEFNESILTYSNTVSGIIDNNQQVTANYSIPSKTLLAGTNVVPGSFPTNTSILLLRFSFTNICNLTKADFSNSFAFLNGYDCSIKFTEPHLLPIANFTKSAGCIGNVNFFDASSATGGAISNWFWNFGNGSTSTLQNPASTYSTKGIYTVTLVATSNAGCASAISKSISINPLPTVVFTSVTDCQNKSISFTNSSTISTGTITAWSWNFGDAASSALKNPTHVYATGGSYTVSLTALSDSGCSSSSRNKILLTTPVPKFSVVSKSCSGTSVSFVDSSTISSGSITAYRWKFSDGVTIFIKNPVRTFNAAGTYTVTLKVTSDLGCSDSLSKVIVIEGKPVVKFGGDVLAGCAPLTVNFKDSSTTANGSTYLWKFGDGDTTSSKNSTHIYGSSGNYTVKLFVTTSAGCNDSLVKSSYIKVSTPPTAMFSVAGGCIGTTSKFIDNSTIASGSISKWNWSFGDGASSLQQNPSRIYPSVGTYTVSLKVTSDENCVDSVSKSITIAGKPIVKFSADKLVGCAPLTVNFSDSSNTLAGSKYFWTFGDNDTSSIKDASHIYKAGGAYSVKLIVESGIGCKDSAIKSSYINVSNAPQAIMEASSGCKNIPLTFKDNSTVSSGSITGWKWYLGNGSISLEKNPSPIYSFNGTYVVSLKVTSINGCTDSTSTTIVIGDKPTIKFGANVFSGCSPLGVVFTDSSNAPASTKYSWNFGDSDTNVTTKNSSHVYRNGGVYSVKHVVTISEGCSDSLIKTGYINVFNTPVVAFKVEPRKTKINKEVEFESLSKDYKNLLWDFGDSTLSTKKNPEHEYTKAGKYKVCLTGQNTLCESTVCDTVIIGNPNIIVCPKAFTPNDDGLNDILRVRGEGVDKIEFRVFNCWGKQVYFATKIEDGWDGKFNNTQQPTGIYQYTIVGTTIENEKINLHGVVSLVR